MQENKKFALKKLSALKERLLDLTARNRMINSNFNARTKQNFRIIDEGIWCWVHNGEAVTTKEFHLSRGEAIEDYERYVEKKELH